MLLPQLQSVYPAVMDMRKTKAKVGEEAAMNQVREANAALVNATRNIPQMPMPQQMQFTPGQAGIALGLGLLGNLIEPGAGTAGVQGYLGGMQQKTQMANDESMRRYQAEQATRDANLDALKLTQNQAMFELQNAQRNSALIRDERQDAEAMMYRREQANLTRQDRARNQRVQEAGRLRDDIRLAPYTMGVKLMEDYNKIASELNLAPLTPDDIKANALDRATKALDTKIRNAAQLNEGLDQQSIERFIAEKERVAKEFGVNPSEIVLAGDATLQGRATKYERLKKLAGDKAARDADMAALRMERLQQQINLAAQMNPLTVAGQQLRNQRIAQIIRDADSTKTINEGVIRQISNQIGTLRIKQKASASDAERRDIEAQIQRLAEYRDELQGNAAAIEEVKTYFVPGAGNIQLPTIQASGTMMEGQTSSGNTVRFRKIN